MITFMSDEGKQRSHIYDKYIKRALDAFFSALAMLLLSPLFAILWVAIRLKLGSPVIFRQERPGKNEKIFRLYKFRTMTNKKGADGKLLPDSERLTPFGRRLRATSMDELPELWNILKGDMSFVGPRPLAVEYLDYYTEQEHKRHSIRPGLTGLAQINGRNAISWEDKFAYDLKYIEKLSLAEDISIIWKTFGKVFKQEAIGQAENAPESLHILRSGQKGGGEKAK